MKLWALANKDNPVDPRYIFTSEEAMINYLSRNRMSHHFDQIKITEMELNEVGERTDVSEYLARTQRDKQIEFVISEVQTKEHKLISALIDAGNCMTDNGSPSYPQNSKRWKTMVDNFALFGFDPRRCKELMGQEKYLLLTLTKYMPDTEAKKNWLTAIKRLKRFSQFQKIGIEGIIEQYGN